MPKVQASGGASSRRAGRGPRVSSSLAEINVVPLVDVMLVLLIIFMVTAPLLQRGIDIKLPTATRASAIQGERIFVNVPLTYRSTRVVYLGDDPIRIEILEERVRQALLNSSSKEVFLRGDGGVQLQELMDVMDRLKAAGVEKVGIVSKRPGER